MSETQPIDLEYIATQMDGAGEGFGVNAEVHQVQRALEPKLGVIFNGRSEKKPVNILPQEPKKQKEVLFELCE